jgi:hypothetical protein
MDLGWTDFLLLIVSVISSGYRIKHEFNDVKFKLIKLAVTMAHKYNGFRIIAVGWEMYFPAQSKPRIMRKNERKTHKCNKYVSLYADGSRTGDNYSYSIEKLF